MSKIYVGHKKNGKTEIFKSDNIPTSESHGNLFFAVTGPFVTMRGAEYFVKNPYLQSVGEAEFYGKKEAIQAML